MRLVETGHRAKVAYFREHRAKARAVGDATLVRNMDRELARLGFQETTQDATVMEMAVPEKPRRGRRPLPRCEHNQIAARCAECADDIDQ